MIGGGTFILSRAFGGDGLKEAGILGPSFGAGGGGGGGGGVITIVVVGAGGGGGGGRGGGVTITVVVFTFLGSDFSPPVSSGVVRKSGVVRNGSMSIC